MARSLNPEMILYTDSLAQCILRDNIPANENSHRSGPTLDQIKAQLMRALRSNETTTSVARFRHLKDLRTTFGSRLAEDESILRQYLEMFNILLFNGHFDFQRCPMQMVLKGEDWRNTYENTMASETRRSINSSGVIESPIVIFEDQYNANNPARRLRLYLGRILHQMIHSYVNINVCACKSCTARLHATDPLSKGDSSLHSTFSLDITK